MDKKGMLTDDEIRLILQAEKEGLCTIKWHTGNPFTNEPGEMIVTWNFPDPRESEKAED